MTTWKEVESPEEQIARLRKERDALAAQVGELRAALEFYADVRNWEAQDGASPEEACQSFEAELDGGDKAHKALSIPVPDALRRLRAKERRKAAKEIDEMAEAKLRLTGTAWLTAKGCVGHLEESADRIERGKA